MFLKLHFIVSFSDLYIYIYSCNDIYIYTYTDLYVIYALLYIYIS